MDPLSIVGLIASIVSIADAVTKSIRKLSLLKTKYQNAPFQITVLIGQLYIVQAAIDELTRWRSKSLSQNPRYRHLAMQIDTALDCFCLLILSLQQYLDEIEASLESDSHGSHVKGKLAYVWNEQDIASYLDLIDRQVNALTLFLQATQCNTWAEQQSKVEEESNQTILQLAKSCSSSILGLADSSSMFSENTNAISLRFDFDSIVLSSMVYQAAHRSHLKQAIRSERQKPHDMDTNQPNIWDVETRSGLSLLPSRGELHTGEGYKDATFEQPMLRPSYEPQSADNNQNASKLATGTATAPPAPTKLSHQGADQRHKRTSLTPFKWFSSGLVQNADKRATEPVIQSPRDLPAPETSYPPAADKVLLLGISEFGKSTIFNALKLFFRDFTEKERSIYTRIIVSSILESTKVVIAAMESRNRALDDAENMAHKQTVLTQLAHPEPSLAKTRAAVRALWADKSFLATYRDTRYYQNSDNILYYVRNIERLTDNMYRPTDRDIPSSRMKSTGITKSIFFGECAPIEVHDLGGCRLERKQWAHMSKNVSTIIFTVDTTSYHRVLIEDETTNRMQEQLMLFEGIGNSYWFPSTRIILVMTKIDQLGSTLQRYPLQQFFPTIPVPPFATPLELEDFYLEALEYQFRSLIKDAGRRGRLHIVRANATNDNTYIVVTDILLAMKGNSNSSLEIYD